MIGKGTGQERGVRREGGAWHSDKASGQQWKGCSKAKPYHTKAEWRYEGTVFLTGNILAQMTAIEKEYTLYISAPLPGRSVVERQAGKRTYVGHALSKLALSLVTPYLMSE